MITRYFMLRTSSLRSSTSVVALEISAVRQPATELGPLSFIAWAPGFLLEDWENEVGPAFHDLLSLGHIVPISNAAADRGPELN